MKRISLLFILQNPKFLRARGQQQFPTEFLSGVFILMYVRTHQPPVFVIKIDDIPTAVYVTFRSLTSLHENPSTLDGFNFTENHDYQGQYRVRVVYIGYALDRGLYIFIYISIDL